MKDVDAELIKIKKVLESTLKKMEKLGDYDLTLFTASVSLGATWVLTANGEVTFQWEKPKPP